MRVVNFIVTSLTGAKYQQQKMQKSVVHTTTSNCPVTHAANPCLSISEPFNRKMQWLKTSYLEFLMVYMEHKLKSDLFSYLTIVELFYDNFVVS